MFRAILENLPLRDIDTSATDIRIRFFANLKKLQLILIKTSRMRSNGSIYKFVDGLKQSNGSFECIHVVHGTEVASQQIRGLCFCPSPRNTILINILLS